MEQVEASLPGAVQPQIDVRALTPPTPRAERVSVLLVIVAVAIALLLGWALKAAVLGRMADYSDGIVSFRYPARWVASQDADGHALVRNPQSVSPRFSDQVIVVHQPRPSSGLPAASPLAEAATAWTLSRAQDLNSFRNLATEDGLTMAGLPAMRVNYAYVADPSAALGRPGIPVVVRGSDTILLIGDTMTIVTGQSAEESWTAFEPVLAKIVQTVRLSPAEGQ